MLPSSAERRPFVIADYVGGVLVEVPLECPWRGCDAPCDVVLHALRARRTGPGHPLAVCRCHAHDLMFSVYPPGFLPFARRPLTISPRSARPASDAAESATGFVAAVAYEPANGLGRALGAVGAAFLREIVALALGLPLVLVAAVAQASDFGRRGRALAAVLEALVDHDGLLLAGALAGRWGVPFRRHCSPQRLQPLVPDHLVDILKRSTSSGSPALPQRKPREREPNGANGLRRTPSRAVTQPAPRLRPATRFQPAPPLGAGQIAGEHAEILRR